MQTKRNSFTFKLSSQCCSCLTVVVLIALIFILWFQSPSKILQPLVPSHELSLAFSSFAPKLNTDKTIHLITIVAEISNWLDNTHHQQIYSSWSNAAQSTLLLVDHPRRCPPSLTCTQHYCNHPIHTIPIVSCLLQTAQNLASSNIILFLNSDILLSPTVIPILQVITPLYPHYLLIGQRFDLLPTVPSPVPTDLYNYARKHGHLHNDWGIDYYIFSKGSLPLSTMPPFVLGNIRWDNWLVAATLASSGTTVIDATAAITAVHFGATATQVMYRPGALINDKLWRQDPLKCSELGLGRISYSTYRLNISGTLSDLSQIVPSVTSSSATEIPITLIPSPHLPRIQQWQLLSRLVHPSGYILTVTLTVDSIPLFENWRHYIAAIPSLRFLILAMDQSSLSYSQHLQLPVLHPPLLLLDQSIRKDHHWVLQQQTLLLTSITSLGLGFLLVSPDTIFFEDPLYFIFGMSSRLQLTAFGIPPESSDIVESFIGVSGCTKSQIWSKITSCQQREKAQSCMSKMFIEDRKYHLLDTNIVAKGGDVFISHSVQQRGVFPAVITSPANLSISETIALYKRWQLWQPPMTPNTSKTASTLTGNCSLQLTIRVKTMARPIALRRLLQSLASADYMGDSVTLELFVMQPDATQKALQSRHTKVISIAQQFKWLHGPLSITQQTSLLFPLTVQSPCTTLLILDETQVVTSLFYHWCKSLCNTYILPFHNTQHFGVSLVHPPPPTGNGSSPHTKVDVSFRFYRYTHVSLFGTLVSADSWNNLVAWTKVPNQSNCVAYLPHKQSIDDTQAWLRSYVFHHGNYALYVNYPSLCPKLECVLVTTAATNKKKLAHKENPLTLPALPPDYLVPLEHFPLYDFYFHRVHSEQGLLHRWRLHSGIKKSSVLCGGSSGVHRGENR